MRIALAQIRPAPTRRPTSSWSRTTRAGPPKRARASCCSPRPRCAASGCRWPGRRTARRAVGHGVRASPSATASSWWRACSARATTGASPTHSSRRGPGRRPLPQDPPLRRVRLHRITHGRTGTRAGGHHGRRRRRRVDHLLRHPLPRALVELARRGAQLITVHASWGSARASSNSGRCSPGPARWTPPASSPRSIRPTRRRDRRRRAYRRRRQPGRLAHRRGAGPRRAPTRVAGRRHRPGRRRAGPRHHRGAAQPHGSLSR